MPAIETAAMPKVAGMARSYAARLSCFVVPVNVPKIKGCF